MRAAWWWIDRWRKSTAYTDMTLAERGAYRELLDECWLRGGVIPADDRILARIAGASPQEWKAVMKAVLAHFEACEGGLRNVTADEVMHQANRRSKNQKAYRDRQRGGHKADNADGNAADNDLDNKPASPSPSPISPSQTPSQTPTQRNNSLVSLALDGAREVFDYWCVMTKRRAPKWSKERKRILDIRLGEEPGEKAEKVAGLKLAVDGALLDPLHNGTKNGTKYLGFENIFKHQGRDRIEKLQEVARNPPRLSGTEKTRARDASIRAGVSGGLRGDHDGSRMDAGDVAAAGRLPGHQGDVAGGIDTPGEGVSGDAGSPERRPVGGRRERGPEQV